MHKAILYKKDLSLESAEKNNLSLSIQLSLDGFSFCITNKDLNKIVALADFPSKERMNPMTLLSYVEQVFADEKLLSLQFKEVKVLHVNQISTLVPVQLFEQEKEREYLAYNQRLLEGEFVAHDILENLEIANIYSPFIEVNNFLIDVFGEFDYMHYSSVLIENFHQRQSFSQGQVLYLNIFEKQIDICVFSSKKLLLYNNFKIKDEKDLIYFVLFCVEQLKLDIEDFKMVLSGQIDKGDKNYQMLYRYIKNIEFIKRGRKHKYSHELDNIPEHRYFELFNI